MLSVRVVVIGRVQGVGFRSYVARQAADFGIQGEVWNRLDGAVEIQAELEDATVFAAFIRCVEKGPGFVTDVKVEQSPLTYAQGFLIGTTR